MKKRTGEKVFTILVSVIFPLMITFCLILSGYSVKAGKINAGFIISIIFTLLSGGFSVVLLIKPYITNFTTPKELRYEYKKLVSANWLNGCITQKVAGLPLLLMLFVICLALAIMGEFLAVASATLFLFPLAILFGLSPLFGLGLLIFFIFLYSLITSLYAINSVIFMMWNKQIKVLWGIFAILILMIPVCDFILAISLRADACKKDIPKIKLKLLLSLIPLFLLILVCTILWYTFTYLIIT